MSNDTDTRDRVIRMEGQILHLSENVEKLTTAVNEMTDLLNQAKGAKWVIIAAASVGGFVAGKIGLFAPWFSGMSK